MEYLKITTVQIVAEDDAEAVIRQMNATMNRIAELQTVYYSSITDETAAEPENAAEIVQP
jgi:hypothetical protein